MALQNMDIYKEFRDNMLKNQIMPNHVYDKSVLNAMHNIPRHEFVPPEWINVAYYDGRIPLGSNRYMLQPDVLARMLQALELQKHHKVLEIGCGTGYATAVISSIAHEVVGIENSNDLALKASNILQKMGSNATIINRELFLGVPEKQPFDAILISGKVTKVPNSLLAQLNSKGKLVCIEKQPGNCSKAILYLNYDGNFDNVELFDADAELLQ